MLFDDYVMRQIKKIAELVAAVAARASGATYSNLDAEIADAYRSLLGLERELADRMSAESLARLLGDPEQIRALALLMKAHGELCAERGQQATAEGLFEKAIALLEHAADPALERELTDRLASVRTSSRDDEPG